MALIDKARAAWRQRAGFRPILQYTSPSFSQYAEDLIFDRLLQPGAAGTYVDVGANHPVFGSNTFRLYLRGWTGIAIDPNPDFAALYRKYRPRDTFLAEGVSREPATLNYHSFAVDVFNTFDPTVVEKLLKEGHELAGTTQVRCRPLAEVVDEMLPERQIDLLNVDCEGLDEEVLDSLDLDRRRPTAIIVEDYPRYISFQRDLPPLGLERFLRGRGYLPLAQTAWSGLYVAEDWRALFKRSAAFDEDRVQNGYLPGQVSLDEHEVEASVRA